ncbi:MAG: PKD domain-containing protein [Bacteroidales bacterium]|nr:PKD domain-containing protein [Bacteroidales bacterium]MBN2763497.1 PKD domain-containing protein [Bacteroidales bacterium]
MQKKLQQIQLLKQSFLFAFALMLICLPGKTTPQSPVDTIIDKPYSVDSLFIIPAMPQEGESITLYAFTTQTSSPCGLTDYQVMYSDSNVIYVFARYWTGPLTALCQSHDSMNIGSLQAGQYELNFMNLKKLAFTVDPKPECKADFKYEIIPSPLMDSMLSSSIIPFGSFLVRFQDLSAGDVTEWVWDFGDGTTSEEQNPHHIFYYPHDTGQYHVCLRITTDKGCTDTYCETIYLWTPHPEVPWEPVIGGEDNHTVVVSENPGLATGLENGDYIGLFFRDYSGDLRCGGMIRWEGKTGILTAWENTSGNDTIWISLEDSIYPVPFYKNGFFEGEKFEYKIWKWRENRIIDVQQANYSVNNVFPDSGYYKDDGMSLLTGFSDCPAQKIVLYSGWNMVSLYVDPVDPRMRDMFGNLSVIVKNFKGEIVYFPYIGITDGIWNNLEGYKVKSFENTSLQITGKHVDPQINIPLPGSKKPYFLPYLYTSPYPVKSMMRYNTNNIRYVQTYEYIDGVIKALNYIPKYDIDQIHYMKPGYAYKLSFITPMRSFTYPPAEEDSVWLSSRDFKSTPDELSVMPEFETENNRILVIPEQVLSIDAGAEVKIFAGNNILVGSETATGGNMAVTMWDLPESEYIIVYLKIEEDGGTSLYTIDLSSQTSIDDGLIVLTEGMISGMDEEETWLAHKLYPTVTDDEISFDVYLEKASDIDIAVYDMLGNRVKQFDFASVSAGMNHFTVAVGNLANGQYLYSIKTNEKLNRGKFQVQH